MTELTNKLSTLVQQQFPDYIKADYPTFVAFVKSYFEFMEQESGAIHLSKMLRDYMDIDNTLDDFETYFLSQYLRNFPEEILADKTLLIKKIKDFYNTKGSEKSFEFLFRILYNEDVSLYYPKQDILIASGGNWVPDFIFYINQYIETRYIVDGLTSEFPLLFLATENDIFKVYVNDTELSETKYSLLKNEAKLRIDYNPTKDSVVRIVYEPVALYRNITTLLSLKFTGKSSGSTFITERIFKKFKTGINCFEFFVSDVQGVSLPGEEYVGKYSYDANTIIDVVCVPLSYVSNIRIVNGGFSYKVGDTFIIDAGDPVIPAKGIISEVFKDSANRVILEQGGAGFVNTNSIVVSGVFDAPNTLNVRIQSIDTSGTIHPNTYSFNSDIINTYATLAINSANYGFPRAGVENANTTIANALSYVTLTNVGPISNLEIVAIADNIQGTPTFDVTPSTITLVSNNASNTVSTTLSKSLKDFGILGRLEIVDGGLGYNVGDEVEFINQVNDFGKGAAAEVIETFPDGSIRTVKFQPSRLTGTANTVSGNNFVYGTNTKFNSELVVNDQVEINNEVRIVTQVVNANLFVVSSNFTRTSTNRKVGVFDRYPIGGIGYSNSRLPTTRVVSSNANATNAIISVKTVLGDGERIIAKATAPIGQILKVDVLESGSGYKSESEIQLTGIGNGEAVVNVSIAAGTVSSIGKYKNSDSHLSADKRLQDGRYYQNYSYVLKAEVSFRKYKELFKRIVHPAGLKNFAEFVYSTNVNSGSDANMDRYIHTTATEITGTANIIQNLVDIEEIQDLNVFNEPYSLVDLDDPDYGFRPNHAENPLLPEDANTILFNALLFESIDPLLIVKGNNTIFRVEVAPGDSIRINNVIRVVDTVFTNTYLKVTKPFKRTYNQNSEIFIIRTI